MVAIRDVAMIRDGGNIDDEVLPYDAPLVMTRNDKRFVKVPAPSRNLVTLSCPAVNDKNKS